MAVASHPEIWPSYRYGLRFVRGFQQEVLRSGAKSVRSGWSWLVVNNGKLEVIGMPNQDSPLMDGKTRSSAWMCGSMHII